MSVRYDITADALETNGYRPLHAGDDYTHEFTAQVDGSALDLSGATIWLTIKDDTTDPDTEAKLAYSTAEDTEVKITDATAGKFSVYLKQADTAKLEGSWQYDIKVKLSGGSFRRLARGTIEFLPNITQATS